MLTLQLLEGSEVCRSMPGPSPLPLPPPSSAAKLPSISQMRRLRLRKGMWLATRHIASKCASWDSTYNCLIQKPKFFLLDSSSFQGFFFFFFLIPIPQMSKLRLQKMKPVVPRHTVGQQLSQGWALGLYD